MVVKPVIGGATTKEPPKMRQERILKRSRRRPDQPCDDVSLMALAPACADTSATDEVLARINQILEP